MHAHLPTPTLQSFNLEGQKGLVPWNFGYELATSHSVSLPMHLDNYNDHQQSADSFLVAR